MIVDSAAPWSSTGARTSESATRSSAASRWAAAAGRSWHASLASTESTWASTMVRSCTEGWSRRRARSRPRRAASGALRARSCRARATARSAGPPTATTRRSGSTTSSAPQAMRACAASGCRAVVESSQAELELAGPRAARTAAITVWRRCDAGAGDVAASSRWTSAVRRSPRWAHASDAARWAARRAVGWVSSPSRTASTAATRRDASEGLPMAAVTRAAMAAASAAIQSSSRPPASWSRAATAVSNRPSSTACSADRSRARRRTDNVPASISWEEREGVGRRSGPVLGPEGPAVRQVEQMAVQAPGRPGRPLGDRAEQAVEVVAVQVCGVAVARAAGGGRGHQCQRRRLADGAGRARGRSGRAADRCRRGWRPTSGRSPGARRAASHRPGRRGAPRRRAARSPSAIPRRGRASRGRGRGHGGAAWPGAGRRRGAW